MALFNFVSSFLRPKLSKNTLLAYLECVSPSESKFLPVWNMFKSVFLPPLRIKCAKVTAERVDYAF